MLRSALTVPPAPIVNTPRPMPPTSSRLVTVSVPPAPTAIAPLAENDDPGAARSRKFTAAPGALISAVPPLLISASVTALGGPVGVQLPALNQLLVAAFQILGAAEACEAKSASTRMSSAAWAVSVRRPVRAGRRMDVLNLVFMGVPVDVCGRLCGRGVALDAWFVKSFRACVFEIVCWRARWSRGAGCFSGVLCRPKVLKTRMSSRNTK